LTINFIWRGKSLLLRNFI